MPPSCDFQSGILHTFNSDIYSVGMFPAGLGQDCITFCEQQNLTCYPQIDLKESTARFSMAGLQCKDEDIDALWKQSYHPAYVNGSGICAGYKSIPARIHCNATPPADGKTMRLCKCLYHGK